MIVAPQASLNQPNSVWQAGAELGEGPVWVDRESALYWVDIKGCAVHRLSWPDGKQKSWQAHGQIGALHPTSDGRFIGAFQDGIHLVTLDPDSDRAVAQLLIDPEPNLPGNRFNDAKVGPGGALWAGTMDDREDDPTGRLYRFSKDKMCQVIDDGYVVTNGPAFSPDGTLLYHTDTFKRIIYVFDLDPGGGASNRRVFTQLPEDTGYPDGMSVDSEGCLWVGHWGGWCLSRFSPEGKRLLELPMPVANVTSCSFGGDDLKTLFVTTAAKGLSALERRDQPAAGDLFALRLDVAGWPTQYFEW